MLFTNHSIYGISFYQPEWTNRNRFILLVPMTLTNPKTSYELRWKQMECLWWGNNWNISQPQEPSVFLVRKSYTLWTAPWSETAHWTPAVPAPASSPCPSQAFVIREAYFLFPLACVRKDNGAGILADILWAHRFWARTEYQWSGTERSRDRSSTPMKSFEPGSNHTWSKSSFWMLQFCEQINSFSSS